MFGNDNHQDDQSQQDQNGVQTAGPTNDFGTMPPIENTPFGTPVVTPTDSPAADTTAPVTDENTAAEAPVEAATPAPSDATSNDLITIKQDALQHLTPLVGHLEQTPEEKFRTTMMMIQAADDQSLVKVAFEAAKEITDDKARAQALLDVINEINYFTQHNS